MMIGTTATIGAMRPMATYGVLWVGWARPSARGRMSSSPIVYSTREAALMQAMTTAKNDAVTPRSTIH